MGVEVGLSCVCSTAESCGVEGRRRGSLLGSKGPRSRGALSVHDVGLHSLDFEIDFINFCSCKVSWVKDTCIFHVEGHEYVWPRECGRLYYAFTFFISLFLLCFPNRQGAYISAMFTLDWDMGPSPKNSRREEVTSCQFSAEASRGIVCFCSLSGASIKKRTCPRQWLLHHSLGPKTRSTCSWLRHTRLGLAQHSLRWLGDPQWEINVCCCKPLKSVEYLLPPENRLI